MNIRKAEPQDIEDLVKHGLSLLKQHSELDPYFTPSDTADKIYQKFFDGCLHSEDKLLLVADNKGKVVAYAAAEIQARSPVFKIRENGYINDIFVEKEFRKLGIARKFLKEFKEWFKSKNIDYVELSVLANNQIAQKTWGKFGFNSYKNKQRVEMGAFNIT
ncbi:MAG: GNAT family N-acetyltransferase [Candidatus Neomarinimicrobiota bacterium]